MESIASFILNLPPLASALIRAESLSAISALKASLPNGTKPKAL